MPAFPQQFASPPLDHTLTKCTVAVLWHHQFEATVTGLPFLEWWSYWRWYGFGHPQVGTWLKIAAGVATAVPLLILILRLARGGALGAGGALHRIEARRLAGEPYTEATVKALEDYLRGSADLVNSIRKTVTAKLSLWFNPRIDAATAASDFDLRDLRRSLHAIYVGVTPDNIARLRPLLALFFQQLVDVQVQTLPGNDPDARHQVLLLLDEFPLLGPMPVLALSPEQRRQASAPEPAALPAEPKREQEQPRLARSR